MRRRTKDNLSKLGLLCLALVLGMGSLGIGYAAWSDTLTIHGTVNTGIWQAGGMRAFLAVEASCRVTVVPGCAWWTAPGIDDHSFTVTIVPPVCDEDNSGDNDYDRDGENSADNAYNKGEPNSADNHYNEDNSDDNFTVIVLPVKGCSLILIYLLRNEGTVPIRLDGIDITTPDWIQLRGWWHLPDHLGWEAMACIKGSMDITEDAKQAIMDRIGIIEATGPSFTAGRILEPGDWGLIFIRLYIVPGAPENTPGTVTVSPVFNPWNH